MLRTLCFLAFTLLLALPNAQATVVNPAASKAATELHESTLSKKELRKKRRAERKEFRKDMKSALKVARAAGDENMALLIILTILLPFAGVWYYEGEWTKRVTLALILNLLFYLPGLIYALIVILE